MPGHNALYVGRHRHMSTLGGGGGGFTPFPLEILSTRTGAPVWVSATGSLTANSGQVVSCSRASSGYALGDDGLLHLLGANTVRVEPASAPGGGGLLVEGASTNRVFPSLPNIGSGMWNTTASGAAAPTTTPNSTDVPDPTGGFTSTKIVFPAVSAPNWSWLVATGAGGTVGWTNSIWLRTLSGSGTIYLIDNSAGNTFAACNVDTTWRRFTFVLPSTGANNFVLGYGSFNVNAAYGGPLTVYAWGAQEESLPFATSNIDTTSGTATRAADLVSVTSPLSGAQNPWRWSFKATPLDTWANVIDTGAGTVGLISLGTSGAANSAKIYSRASGNTDALVAVVDNASGLDLRLATAFLAGSGEVQANLLNTGGTWSGTPTLSAFVSGSGVISAQPATLYLGTLSTGSTLFGHMRDIFLDIT